MGKCSKSVSVAALYITLNLIDIFVQVPSVVVFTTTDGTCTPLLLFKRSIDLHFQIEKNAISILKSVTFLIWVLIDTWRSIYKNFGDFDEIILIRQVLFNFFNIKVTSTTYFIWIVENNSSISI